MFFPPEMPDWETDGRDWPHRSTSRFVNAGDLRWHIQEMGQGPNLLLVHGTAGATHSWRGLMPLLAERFRVTAMDLPGHGFTDMPETYRVSLPGMARFVRDLVTTLDLKPDVVVGHSAGAAILIRMVLDGTIAPRGIVSLNGALMPFPGMGGYIFPQLAKLLLLNPIAPRLFAFSTGHGAHVERLIVQMGSKIDQEGLDLYTRLFRKSGHVAGAIGMMANWDLNRLSRDMRKLMVPLYLIAGTDDQAIPPHVAQDVMGLVSQGGGSAETLQLDGLGHLAHEEDPAKLAEIVLEWCAGLGFGTRPDD